MAQILHMHCSAHILDIFGNDLGTMVHSRENKSFLHTAHVVQTVHRSRTSRTRGKQMRNLGNAINLSDERHGHVMMFVVKALLD